MDVEKLGDVIMPLVRIFFTERGADCSGFLLNECSLIRYGLNVKYQKIGAARPG